MFNKAEVDMDIHMVNALILAKMALMDGVIDDREKTMLNEVCAELPSRPDVDELIENARRTPIDSLLSGIKSYEDQLLIAMRAFSMANVDADFHPDEQSLYEQIAQTFDISSTDRELIEEVGLLALEHSMSHFPKRMIDIYAQSSFWDDE